jgi:D-glycero-alpha-D-manno-heptose-7-phosphate kinase
MVLAFLLAPAWEQHCPKSGDVSSAIVPPSRVIVATAPIRICDIGGWTDTWVARHGQVLNIAVRPLVVVRIEVFPRESRDSRVTINAENYRLRYSPNLDASTWGPHPLLEAALRSIPPPLDVDIEATVRSDAPPGASTGSSAAVAVALLAALNLLTGGHRSPEQIAGEAHRLETDQLSRQSGVQDQLCSALGGVNFIQIVDYPRAVVTRLDLPEQTMQELERRLVLIYLGRPHSSSAVHASVMLELERLGADCRPLEALRRAAGHARDAVLAGDFAALGRSMTENAAAQADLHPDLVHGDSWRVSEIAAAHGALGWKVNGAGGDGGSITILCGASTEAKEAMIRAIQLENSALQSIPVALSRDGVRAWNEIGDL